MNTTKNNDLSSPQISAGEFVKDKPCLCFRSEDTVCSIVEKMRENHIYAVAIVENESLEGLLTGHDILIRAASWRSQGAPSMESLAKAFNSMRAADVMIRNPVVIEAQTSLDEAVRIMTNNGFRHLPVIKNNYPVGILNIGDVAQYMVKKVRKDSEEKDAIISYVMHHENYGCVPQD